MAMKTILVPTENHAAMRSALETALLLGRRCESYIEGFALQFGINEFSAIDMGGGLSLETFKQESQEDAAQAKKLFESFMAEHKVPRAAGLKGALSHGWLKVSSAAMGECST
jgi:diaminopimelate decarboxylase